MKNLPLKSVSIGEPDANAEYFLAKKAQKEPIFIEAYYENDPSNSKAMRDGSKFLIYGQKGTGKTAILRHLERSSSTNYSTRFVVFRKEIVEEAELSSLAASDGVWQLYTLLSKSILI